MKIKILTFQCAKNYGAVLQAYALLTTLNKYFNNVEFINYYPRFLSDSNLFNFNINHPMDFITSLMRGLGYLIKVVFCGYGMKIHRFSKFRRDNLHINDRNVFRKLKDVSANDADCVFIGSDQVWNSRITKYDTVYLGEFKKPPSCRLVAYAASVGNDASLDIERKFLSKYLHNFYKISVRENTAQNLLIKYRKDIDVVLDPVFLLSQKEWRNIAIAQGEKKYVLLYCMSNNDITTQISYRIAHSLNLDVVEVLSGVRSLRRRYRHKIFQSAGPREFLGLVSDASYIVTSSFHGTAFSLIFNKQFVTVAHPTAGSRQRDLLARIGLSNRAVSSVDDLPKSDIDYSIVNKRLDSERRKSIDFIERALGVKRNI